MNKIILLPITALLFTGCFLPRYTTFKIDYPKKAFEIVYHDIRTDATTDTAALADWKLLQEMATVKDTSYDTNIVTMASQKLFQEDSVLSGKRTYSIKCPACFPSRMELLKHLMRPIEDGDFQWAELNGDIILSVSSGNSLKSSNGKITKTRNAGLIAWSNKDSIFEFTYGPDSLDAHTSILPLYLKSLPAKDVKKRRGK